MDPTDGTVLLRLVPLHIERRHGPLPPNPRWVSDVNGDSLPFPLLDGAAPVDVALSPGLTPSSLKDAGLSRSSGTEFNGRYWFYWSAYARLPIGWSTQVTAAFRVGAGQSVEAGPLWYIHLHMSGGPPDRRFDLMDGWLRTELGPPPMSAGDKKRNLAKRVRRWDFDWGDVGLYYELRDREPELQVTWGA